MRILFLTKSDAVVGGVERWLADLAVGLSAWGHECIVGLAEGARFHDPERYRRAYPELNTASLDGTSGAAEGRRLAVRAALRRLQPEIVMPVMLADGLTACAEMKRKLGYRIVYAVHEICDGVCRDLERYGAWMDRVVFVDSSGMAAFSDCCPESKGRQTLIPCGVSEGLVSRVGKAPGQPLEVGFCGRLEGGQKRVDDLIALCDELERIGLDYRLTIIGEGSARDRLLAGLAEPIERGRAVVQEAQTRAELYRSFYPRIDALMVPSERETGPLIAFEAMMNGCVVLTADFKGRKENDQLRDRDNCLVFPVGDMRLAAELLEGLKADPEKGLRLAERAKEFSVQHRSLTRMVDRWDNMLRELMQEDAVAVAGDVKAGGNGTSRLARLGLPAGVSEAIRRMTGRRFVHASAGEEWPRYTG